jgi:hypothetical protein
MRLIDVLIDEWCGCSFVTLIIRLTCYVVLDDECPAILLIASMEYR